MSLATHVRHSAQQGISLVVTLVMLLALTLIGVAALGNNNLQVRMANNAVESNASFQNAETSLVYAEKWLELQNERPLRTDAYLTGQADSAEAWLPGALTQTTCSLTPCPQVYVKADWWDNSGDARSYSADYPEGGTATPVAGRSVTNTYNSIAPRYVVEELGPDQNRSLSTGQGKTYRVYYYRITAQAYASQKQSVTITQSVYARPFSNN